MRVAVLLLFGAAAAAQGIEAEPLAPDPARDARVAKLIEDLLAIAEPYDGITLTSGGGVGFDAIHDAKDTPPAFRELVRFGPAAIPALLAHLDDKRETKLKFSWVHELMGSRMYLQPEIDAGSQEERVRIRRVLGAEAEKDGPVERELEEKIDGHTVTVGDCCFVILGQIVNRSYEAVRYQPSLLAIVSSPTREPKIAKILRGRWGRGDPRQILAQSLLSDLRRSYGQAGAAKRLLFYFPDSAGPLVAKRISALLGYPFRDRDGEDLLCAAMATGNALVRAEWLKLLDTHRPVKGQLAALAATPDDPGDDARERIRTMRAESEELEVVLACVRALPGEPSPRAFAWLKKQFARVETRDAGWTRAILAALAALDEEASIPIFLAHIEKLQNFGWGNVLTVLQDRSQPKLAVALLREKLDSRDLIEPRPVPAPRLFKEEMRWCDLAAAVLAEAKHELAFDPYGPVEERDRQIAAIRAALAK